MDEGPIPPALPPERPAEPAMNPEEPEAAPEAGETAAEVEAAPRGDNLATAMAVGIAVLLLICVALMLAAWHHAAPGLVDAAAWWRF